jgi:hypothetical protein
MSFPEKAHTPSSGSFDNREKVQNQAVSQAFHAEVNFVNHTYAKGHEPVDFNGKEGYVPDIICAVLTYIIESSALRDDGMSLENPLKTLQLLS